MWPWFVETCRSYGAAPFASGSFYKHSAPTALKWFFNRLLALPVMRRARFAATEKRKLTISLAADKTPHRQVPHRP